MTIKVDQIRPGMTIKFELGDYDNWVTAKVVKPNGITSSYYCFTMNDEDRGDYNVWFNRFDTVEVVD
nr:MAG TPA: cold shock protein [Caudoviricetes sp.]